MKYYEDGQWKDIQVKVANAIQNEYGDSQNDGYSQEYLNDHLVNVSTVVDDTYRVNLLHSNNILEKTTFVNGDYRDAEASRARRASTRDSIYLEAGTYTCSTDIDLTLYNYAVIMVPNVPPSTSYNAYYDTGWLSVSSTTFTITTPGYFGIQARRTNDADFNASALSSYTFHLTKGTTSTTEPFMQNQIVVDNEKYSDTLNVGTSLDNRNRVNVLKSKNLFDIKGTWEANNPITTGGMTYTLNSDGSLTISNTSTGYSGAYGRPYNETKPFITLKANHTYRLLVKITNKTSDKFSAVYMGVTNDNLNNKVAVREISSSGIKYTDFSFTSDQVLTQYSMIGANNSGASETGMKMEIALYDITGLSTPPTTYEPYITPSIYVDNEMLVSKNVYSSGEVVIGEWFGKTLYRKVVTISSLPNNTNVEYDIFSNTSEIDTCWVDVGNSYVSLSNNSLKYPVNWIWTTSAYMFTGINGKKLRIKTTENQSANSGYFVINYTKN